MNQPFESVSLVDLIDRLVEVPEPLPVSMWPQTWGWVVVGVLGAAILTWLAFTLIKRYRANAYRRTALAELETAGDDAVAVARVLRRTALAAFPRREVAHLAGRDWLEFLDSTANGVAFTTGPGSSIAAAPYQAGIEAEGVGAVAKMWVRNHQVKVST